MRRVTGTLAVLSAAVTFGACGRDAPGGRTPAAALSQGAQVVRQASSTGPTEILAAACARRRSDRLARPLLALDRVALARQVRAEAAQIERYAGLLHDTGIRHHKAGSLRRQAQTLEAIARTALAGKPVGTGVRDYIDQLTREPADPEGCGPDPLRHGTLRAWVRTADRVCAGARRGLVSLGVIPENGTGEAAVHLGQEAALFEAVARDVHAEAAPQPVRGAARRAAGAQRDYAAVYAAQSQALVSGDRGAYQRAFDRTELLGARRQLAWTRLGARACAQ